MDGDDYNDSDRSARDREARSPSCFIASSARSPRLAGSLLFIANEPAIMATPATVVKGSGARASAIPTFLTVPLNDGGWVSLLRLRLVSSESRARESWTQSRDILFRDSTRAWIPARPLSCIVVARWHQPRINPAGQRRSVKNSVFVYQPPAPVHPSASPPFLCPWRDAKHGLTRGPSYRPPCITRFFSNQIRRAAGRPAGRAQGHYGCISMSSAAPVLDKVNWSTWAKHSVYCRI